MKRTAMREVSDCVFRSLWLGTKKVIAYLWIALPLYAFYVVYLHKLDIGSTSDFAVWVFSLAVVTMFAYHAMPLPLRRSFREV